MRTTGPDAPTLCDGWTVRDLVAHLVIRENRPDASAGLVVPQLAGYTEKVQGAAARRTSFEDLVTKFDNGPSKLSVFALPGVDSLANTAEFLVHHEDVLRAQPDWQPRELSAADANQIWRELPRMTTLATRRLNVGLVAEHPDGRVRTLSKGEPVAIISGEPLEILLYLFGRRDVARIELKGNPDAVAVVAGKKFAA